MPQYMGPKRTRRLRPTVVSLFSGCGGMDLGFERAGFRVTHMVETSPFACQTLRTNFPSAQVLGPPADSGDVREVDFAKIPTPDVLIGGPPCQSFSIAAAQRFLKGDAKFKRIGFADAQRGDLLQEYLRALECLRPHAFVLENVVGLQALDGGRQLARFIDRCVHMDYSVTAPTTVEAADYGVPQLRKRLIVVGVVGDLFKFPHATHSAVPNPLAHPYVTVGEALWDLSDDADNHDPRQHKPASVARYRRLLPGQREHLGRVDRLRVDRPSKTVIAGGQNGGGRSHLHPFVARTLTVRECARLQTFPDSFVLSGTASRQFTQVGNAVPPLLAEAIARSLGDQVFGLPPTGTPTLARNSPGSSISECAHTLLARAAAAPRMVYRDLDTSRPVGHLVDAKHSPRLRLSIGP